MIKTIYANALLLDGEILFWYTGSCSDVHDFYKDFYYSGYKMSEFDTKYKLEVKRIGFEYDDEAQDSNFIFDVLAENFYKQFKISDKSKGRLPY